MRLASCALAGWCCGVIGEVLTLAFVYAYIGCVEYFVRLTRQRVCVTCAWWRVREWEGAGVGGC